MSIKLNWFENHKMIHKCDSRLFAQAIVMNQIWSILQQLEANRSQLKQVEDSIWVQVESKAIQMLYGFILMQIKAELKQFSLTCIKLSSAQHFCVSCDEIKRNLIKHFSCMQQHNDRTATGAQIISNSSWNLNNFCESKWWLQAWNEAHRFEITRSKSNHFW